MTISQSNQHGFSVVETVLVLVILGAIGAVGGYVYHSSQASTDSLNAASAVNTSASPKFSAKKTAAPSGDSQQALSASLSAAGQSSAASDTALSDSSTALNDQSSFTASQLPQ